MTKSIHSYQKTSCLAWISIGIILWMLKIYYRQAQVPDLWWVLKPLSLLVTALSPCEFTYVASIGFYEPHFHLTIDKSCSGFNYMLIAFGLISLCHVSKFQTLFSKMIFVLTSFVMAYFFAIVINAFRIVNTLSFQDFIQKKLSLSASMSHETIGVLTFFSFLALYFCFVNYCITLYFTRNYEKNI